MVEEAEVFPIDSNPKFLFWGVFDQIPAAVGVDQDKEDKSQGEDIG